VQYFCNFCKLEIDNRCDPAMDGKPRPNWVHAYGGYQICFPQDVSSPRAEPFCEHPETTETTRLGDAYVRVLCVSLCGMEMITGQPMGEDVYFEDVYFGGLD
jgi:hypothetical protein